MNVIRRLLKHKVTLVVIGLLAIGSVHFGYTKIQSSKSTAPQYVTTLVEKGTIVVSVNGSGQVSVSNQVDLKPKASGDIVSLPIVQGQDVKAGVLIAQLDSREAQKAVRDAEVNVTSAKISLEKLQQPADDLTITQAEHTLARANESKQQSQDSLIKAFEDGFNTISNAFLDLPEIMTGLRAILYTNTIGLGANGQWNIDFYTDSVTSYDMKALDYKADVADAYSVARTAYDKNFEDYKATGRSSDTATIEVLISQTYETTKDIADAIKSASNLIQFYKDKMTERGLKPASPADTHLSSLNTYTGQTNAHLLNLLGIKNTIQTDRATIVNADRTITENTASLAKLNADTDALDLASAKLTVEQRENALQDAQEKLADYVVRAPFDGAIAVVNSKKSDAVTSGTAIATLITKQKIAEISLNEVDVAKIKVGQNATLTFDAIEGLSISGAVAEIGSIGTVTQGVVSYGIKIGFDTQDDRVKPGMSVSATIATEVKTDILLVPIAAIKSQDNGGSYVEIMEGAVPRMQEVQVGISNDTLTEITDGLNEGDPVVTQTIESSQPSTQTTQQGTGGSLIPGLGGGGGQFRTGGFGR